MKRLLRMSIKAKLFISAFVISIISIYFGFRQYQTFNKFEKTIVETKQILEVRRGLAEMKGISNQVINFAMEINDNNEAKIITSLYQNFLNNSARYDVIIKELQGILLEKNWGEDFFIFKKELSDNLNKLNILYSVVLSTNLNKIYEIKINTVKLQNESKSDIVGSPKFSDIKYMAAIIDSTEKNIARQLIVQDASANIISEKFANNGTSLVAMAKKEILIALITIILAIISGVVFVLTITSSISTPILKLKDNILTLSQGTFPDVQVVQTEEMLEISTAFYNLVNGLKETKNFADELGKGKLDVEFKLTNKDVLAQSLLKMQESLNKANVEEEKRKQDEEKQNWTTEGLAKFGEILRAKGDDLNSFCYDIIKNLVVYLKANQGGIFILNDNDKEDVYYELISCYAYERRKFMEKKIYLGEGLAGACIQEKQTMFMTDIPHNYVTITSGLGGDNPRSLLLVPLKLEETIYGLLEIASFTVLDEYQINFVEKLGESIASTISNVKVNIRTAYLLEQSQEQSEELKAQEEELLQNLEELTTVQEELRNKELLQQEEIERLNHDNKVKLDELRHAQDEMKRGEAELRWNMDAINKTIAVIEYDFSGIILKVNEIYCKITGYTPKELIGNHIDLLIENEIIGSSGYKAFWNKISDGFIMEGVQERIAKNNSKLYINGVVKPLFDNNGLPHKVMEAGVNITDLKAMEKDLKFQNEEVIAQSEELKQNMEEMLSIQEELKKKEATISSYLGAMNSSMGVYYLDSDCVIIDANEFLLNIINMNKEEFIGNHISYFMNQEKTKTSGFEAFLENLSNGKKQSGGHQFFFNGKEIWLYESFSPITDENGKFEKIMCLANDISKVREQEQLLKTRAEEQKKKDLDTLAKYEDMLYESHVKVQALEDKIVSITK